MTTRPENIAPEPYVGPRTFDYKDRKLFFGREREAHNLLARVVSERLLLFYAQSGAGKSSLINTRLIPQLRVEENFSVLPIGRVSGDIQEGVKDVENIYIFNLIASLDPGSSPAQLAPLTLTEFLEHLVTEDGFNWRYDPTLSQAFNENEKEDRLDSAPNSALRFALIIDQFEEIITGHPGRWPERESFFQQLDEAMQKNPNLWIVLTLREDYVAALDPYAPLLFNRLRARFYMERMGEESALQAIRQPAELGGRTFAPGVAETLVKELRQVRVPGRTETITGQYLEPLQLQVVCFRLWERLNKQYGTPSGNGKQEQSAVPGQSINESDLEEAGNVDQALRAFYVETLDEVLDEEQVQQAGVTERELRTWFSAELITEDGIRNPLFRNEQTGKTGSMRNVVVDALAKRFLLHSELRGGGTLVNVMHDRFVEPILQSNLIWFERNALPQIVRFKVHPHVVTRGMSVSIEWSVINADMIMLEPGNHVLGGLQGNVVLQPEETQNYRLSTRRAQSQPVHSATHTVRVIPNRLNEDKIRDALERGRFSFVIGPEFDKAVFDSLEIEPYSEWEPADPKNENLRAYYSGRYERLLSEEKSFPGQDLLQQMANMPGSIYITASFHPFLEEALIKAGRQPRSDTYRMSEYLGLFSYPDPGFLPTPDEPLVFHMFGIDSFPQSLLLTEEDYFRFLISLSEDRDKIPILVRYALAMYYKAIIGFDISDWAFKTFWHGVDAENKILGPGGLVQVLAQSAMEKSDITRLEANLARHKYDTVWGTSRDLMAWLYRTLMGEDR